MARRRIGQERLGVIANDVAGTALEQIAALIDWSEVDRPLVGIYAAARGERGWPPLALFRAMLLAVWHDLSDVKLAEALEIGRGTGRPGQLPPVLRLLRFRTHTERTWAKTVIP